MTATPPPGRPLARSLQILLIALTGIPLLVVGALTYSAARDTTRTLLSDRSELLVDAIAGRVTSLLDPAAGQAAYLASVVAAGSVDLDDPVARRALLLGALAASPQVAGMEILRPDLTGTRLMRSADEAQEQEWAGLARKEEDVARARSSLEPWWAEPIWSPFLSQPVLPLRVPLHGPQGFVGLLSAVIATDTLSEYLGALTGNKFQGTPFVLLGPDLVLAHRSFVGRRLPPTTPASSALASVVDVGDPVLAAFPTAERGRLTASAPFRRAVGHWSRVDGEIHVFIHRTLEGYGDQRLTVGFHYPGWETRRVRWLMVGISVTSVLVIGATALVALRIGRVLSTPAVQLAAAARQIGSLEFDRLPPLSPSLFREFNEASSAFRQMAAALAMFRAYLPRRLVQRLFERGEAPAAELRHLTVMFADLQGYTAYAAGRPANEVVAFLNDLLATVGPIIEETGGTIDKYMGDAVMAFWGAPDELPDHVGRACSAALAIIDAMGAINGRRRSVGEPTCALRIGLHKGEVLVGNVGFEGRINYTIIGEVANIAQRLEQRARPIMATHDAAALVSVEVKQAVEERFAFEPGPPNDTGPESWRLVDGPRR